MLKALKEFFGVATKPATTKPEDYDYNEGAFHRNGQFRFVVGDTLDFDTVATKDFMLLAYDTTCTGWQIIDKKQADPKAVFSSDVYVIKDLNGDVFEEEKANVDCRFKARHTVIKPPQLSPA